MGLTDKNSSRDSRPQSGKQNKKQCSEMNHWFGENFQGEVETTRNKHEKELNVENKTQWDNKPITGTWLSSL